MHGPNDEDEGREKPENGESEPQEGWFRFGDEPDPASVPDEGERVSATSPEPAGSPAPVPEPVPDPDPDPDPDPEPDPKPVAVTAAEDAPVADEPDPEPRVAPVAATAVVVEEEEERIKPFVVSATPGGVDPNLTEAADAAVVTSMAGGRGFGFVGILTVVLAFFGVGLLVLNGPRAAEAEATSGSGAIWLTDIDEAMAISAAEGRPMLVQFTADWCPPCVAMRENVFSSSAVQDRLATRFVTVRIDLTERGGANDRIAQRFEVRSIPDIQIYHPDGWQMQRLGYVGGAGEFLGKLDSIDRP